MQTTRLTKHQICQVIENLVINGNLHKLAAALEVIVAQNDDSILIPVNMVLSKPANLKHLIRQILNDAMLFDAVRIGSYCHKNGFHKIVLMQGANFKLRLHHFGARGLSAMENIHDHRWPFASNILVGKLCMQMFEANRNTREGELLMHHEYNSDKSSGAYSTTLRGFALLNKTKELFLQAGDSYMMMPEDLHRIISKQGEESITLILTGKPRGKTCNLYSKRVITHEEKETPNYGVSELRSHLEKLGEIIYPQYN